MNKIEYHFRMTTLEYGTEEFGPYSTKGERSDAISSLQDANDGYCEIEKFEKQCVAEVEEV